MNLRRWCNCWCNCAGCCEDAVKHVCCIHLLSWCHKFALWHLCDTLRCYTSSYTSGVSSSGLRPKSRYWKRRMQLKFQRILAKPSTGLQWQKYRQCLLLLSHLSLPAGYIVLLFYALVWEAGNIVSLPTKRIGFYNFCLWNQKAEELDCLSFKDLEEVGISKIALVLSRVCVYSTPVVCLFVTTTILQALWFKDKDGWKLVRTLLAICALILPVGLALFLLETQRWIRVSELSEVFAALAGAHVLLLLHLICTVMYLAQFKETLSPGELFPQKGPLMSV